jgi:hypothetical protein
MLQFDSLLLKKFQSFSDWVSVTFGFSNFKVAKLLMILCVIDTAWEIYLKITYCNIDPKSSIPVFSIFFSLLFIVLYDYTIRICEKLSVLNSGTINPAYVMLQPWRFMKIVFIFMGITLLTIDLTAHIFLTPSPSLNHEKDHIHHLTDICYLLWDIYNHSVYCLFSFLLYKT